jgi:putative Mg2+ transporter-C (MgtC) family protein
MLFQTIEIELLGEVPVYLGVGIQILSAVLLGGMVGYDREKKSKAAGLKTNMLICLGATLYTTISLLLVKSSIGGPVDPNRVGAQIVSGIGFLGAGAIIQGRGSVVGMTTAATIWVVAAIGYTIGVGYPVSAGIFSLTVLVVLKFINPLYKFLENETVTEYFHIEVLSLGSVKRSILETIKLEDVEFDEAYEDVVDKKRSVFTLYLYANPRAMDRIIIGIKNIASVEKVSHHQLDKDDKWEKGDSVVEFKAASNKTSSKS